MQSRQAAKKRHTTKFLRGVSMFSSGTTKQQKANTVIPAKAGIQDPASHLHIAEAVHVLDPRLRPAGMTKKVSSHNALAMTLSLESLRVKLRVFVRKSRRKSRNRRNDWSDLPADIVHHIFSIPFSRRVNRYIFRSGRKKVSRLLLTSHQEKETRVARPTIHATVRMRSRLPPRNRAG